MIKQLKIKLRSLQILNDKTTLVYLIASICLSTGLKKIKFKILNEINWIIQGSFCESVLKIYFYNNYQHGYYLRARRKRFSRTKLFETSKNDKRGAKKICSYPETKMCM